MPDMDAAAYVTAAVDPFRQDERLSEQMNVDAALTAFGERQATGFLCVSPATRAPYNCRGRSYATDADGG
jgi:hypothetical protein